MISETTIQTIKKRAKIEDFTTEALKAYGDYKLYCICPQCQKVNHKKKSGLIIFSQKQTAKCYSCGAYYSNPIDFVMKTKSIDYPEALKSIASHYHILIDESEHSTKNTKKSNKKNLKLQDQEVSTEIEKKETCFGTVEKFNKFSFQK